MSVTLTIGIIATLRANSPEVSMNRREVITK